MLIVMISCYDPAHMGCKSIGVGLAKVHPGWTQSPSRMDPKSIQDGVKVHPGWTLGPSWMESKSIVDGLELKIPVILQGNLIE
jgi:hypothetical protein